MRERRYSGLRDLRVVLGRVEACTDRTDHLAIDHDWKASLHLDEAARAVTAAMRPWSIASSSAPLGFLNNAAVLALPQVRHWRYRRRGPCVQ